MLDRVEWLKARGRRRERGEFRASDADREDAYRRLEVHQTMGHIDEEARLRIRAAVEVAETPNEITKIFVDEGLPELPARSPSTEHRVSAQDRAAAIGLLEKAFAESRITADECAEATDRVSKARTRSEVDAAFHGLSTPSRVAVEKAAANVAEKTAKLSTRALGEGGRRAQKAFLHGVLAVGALMIGVIFLIAGVGTVALISFLGSVALFVSAARALVTSQSSA